MITKTYKPSISNQDIQSALNMENVEYSKENKAQLEEAKRKYRLGVLGLSGALLLLGVISFFIGRLLSSHWVGMFGMFVGVGLAAAGPIYFVQKMISSFISASQKDPKAVMHSFLKELVNNIKYDSLTFTDISKVFPLLTPSTSKSISVKSLSDDFLKISQDIRSAVKYQETANCSACGASRNGLWSVESWSLVDEWKLSDKGVEEDGYLLQCNHCKAVFCSTCYLKNIFKVGSQQIPDCPGCGKQMSGEQYMNVFAPDPPIQVGVISIENILAENVNERQSHLHAKVKIIFEIKKIIVPENPYASKSMELGDRGIIECEFSNVAVRIGEKWYLLAVPQSEVVST